MDQFMDAEARFLNADTLIERGQFAEAKEVLMGILEDEPGYGRAHNHLGWLYRARLSDFANAEYHLRLAVRFAPDYPAGYLNYGHLLAELGEYEQLCKLAAQAIQVRGINKASVLQFMAIAEEMKGGLKESLKILQKAKAETMDENMLNFIEGEIRRVKRKMSTFSRLTVMF